MTVFHLLHLCWHNQYRSITSDSRSGFSSASCSGLFSVTNSAISTAYSTACSLACSFAIRPACSPDSSFVTCPVCCSTLLVEQQSSVTSSVISLTSSSVISPTTRLVICSVYCFATYANTIFTCSLCTGSFVSTTRKELCFYHSF